RIPGKRAREAMRQNADLARLSRELVTIRRDVPLPLDLDRLRVRPPDVTRLTELFTELEFRSLIPKLSSLEVVGAGDAAPAAQRAPAGAGAGAARRSARAEGGAQHQVRLAGTAPSRGGARGCVVRLHARELRARSRTTLTRPRRAGARTAVPRGADVRRARGPGKGRASVRCGAPGGRRALLCSGQRDRTAP